MLLLSFLIALFIYEALTLSISFAAAIWIALFLALAVPVFLIQRRIPAEILLPNLRKNRRALITVAITLLALLVAKGYWLQRFHTSGENLLKDEEQADIMARRAYLIRRVTADSFGLADMPQIIEKFYQQQWGMVTFSMTSIALVNIALAHPETRDGALAAMEKIVPKMLEPQFSTHEDFFWGEDALKSLDGPNGHAGYLGHLNIILAAYRLIGGDAKYDDLNRKITDALARRVAESPNHYIETFPAAKFTPSIFVPDTMAVLASIAWSDLAQGTDHAEVLRAWSAYNREHNIDPETGLLRPWVKTGGEAYGSPRGSYTAWNAIFLPHVDAALASEQFQAMKRTFVVRFPPGAAAIREYLPGIRGAGDRDSGPVLFGLSTSGTGFAVAGARISGDAELVSGLLRTAELAGFSWDDAGERHYLAGPLIGDAILLAGKTARAWDNRYRKK